MNKYVDPEYVPVLDAYSFKSDNGTEYVLAWCEMCIKYHTHGAASGRRVAHCWHWDAPKSYEIKIIGEATPEMIGHLGVVRKEKRNYPDCGFNELLLQFEELNILPQVRIFNPYETIEIDNDYKPMFVGLSYFWNRSRFMCYVFAQMDGALVIHDKHLQAGLLALAPDDFWAEHYGSDWKDNNAKKVAYALIGMHRDENKYKVELPNMMIYRGDGDPFESMPAHCVMGIAEKYYGENNT